MGQKANPISLRLKTTNKSFASCWYSDFYYPRLITQDLQIRQYLDKLFTQIKYPNPFLSVSFFPKNTKTMAIYLNPFESRHRRCERFKLKVVEKVRPNPSPMGHSSSMISKDSCLGKTGSISTTNQKTIIGTAIQGSHLGSLTQGMEKREKDGKRHISVSFAEKSKRFFVERLLLSMSVQSGNSKELSWKRDFQFFQKLHRITWFQGREESFFLIPSKQLSGSSHRAPVQRSGQRDRPRLSGLQRTDIANAISRVKRNTRGAINLAVDEVAANGHSLNSQRVPHYHQPSRGCIRFHTDTASIAGNTDTHGFTHQLANRRKDHIHITTLESIIYKGLNTPTTLWFHKSIHDTQSAHFLSDEIAYYLERRVPFRRIKGLLLRELRTPYIEGVRVICSGRVGGRSKKAQRARGERFQLGQTSSHVFSSNLSFASRSALTPFGKVGIKVWICYK